MKRPASLAALSGILLAASFPRFSLGFFAWVALIPLLLVIQNSKSRKHAVFYAAVTGIVFFGISISWLRHVAFAAWICAVALETVFVALFGWFMYDTRKIPSLFFRALWTAAAWTVTEIFRAEIPEFGFGWNLLGYSQADYPVIVQSANAIGVYGLSFILAWANAAGLEICRFIKQGKSQNSPLRTEKSSIAILSVFFVFVITALLAHGRYYLSKENPLPRTAKISVVQGNIPQSVKWEVMAKEKIIEIYSKLTELASYEKPDLIVWPEAAFPGYFSRDVESEEIHRLIRNLGVPVLIGSPHFEDEKTIFNSAYLVGASGMLIERYDKLTLVPFGEYVPFPAVLGWLAPLAYSMGVGDFSPGTERTVFRSEGIPPFSALICFEDVFPNTARKFVAAGAEFLAVITNDAWFGDSAAPYQHLQQSILRAVENGVPVVRAANTGVSAFITPQGKVVGKVSDASGREVNVLGRKTMNISLGSETTLYRKGGFYFAPFAIILFLIMYFSIRFKKIPALNTAEAA